MNSSTQTKQVNVTLLKNHTHAGNKYGAGSLLTIDAAGADWLIQQGIAEPEKKGSGEGAAFTPDKKKLT